MVLYNVDIMKIVFLNKNKSKEYNYLILFYYLYI